MWPRPSRIRSVTNGLEWSQKDKLKVGSEDCERGEKKPSFNLKRKKNPLGAAEITSAEAEFLSAISRSVAATDEHNISDSQKTWLEYVRVKVEQHSEEELKAVLHIEASSTADTAKDILMSKCFLFLARLAQITAEESNFSIDKCVAILSISEGQCLKTDILQSPHRDFARKLVFCGISWITMLFPADSTPIPGNDVLRVLKGQCHCMDHFQPSSNSERPLCEVLRDFGPLLPEADDQPSTVDMREQGFDSNSLYVSILNAATLKRLGDIQIVWIDNIGSHLLFDPDERLLMMFRLPSFCNIPRMKSNSLSRILLDYHDGFDRPMETTYDKLLKEVQRSYQLIFSDDSSSRHRFNHKERRKLKELGIVDPYLIELCGSSSNLPSKRNSYSKSRDFRIFRGRLSLIQDHMLRQQTKSLSMIWQDTRNPERWWTFWAVVYIGGISLFLSLVQTLLAGIQVYYAKRS